MPPIALTVDQAAERFDVTPKTIREWIRLDGLPVLRTGGKGPGAGALIDGARLPAWLREHRGDRPSAAASWLRSEHRQRMNPIRDLIELHHHRTLAAIALAVRSWAEHPNDHPASWKQIGLTADQAKQAAAGLWLHAALYASAYTFEGSFERDVAAASDGGDLDDWASILLEADVQTRWERTGVEIPPELIAMLPKATREALSTKPKRKSRARG